MARRGRLTAGSGDKTYCAEGYIQTLSAAMACLANSVPVDLGPSLAQHSALQFVAHISCLPLAQSALQQVK